MSAMSDLALGVQRSTSSTTTEAGAGERWIGVGHSRRERGTDAAIEAGRAAVAGRSAKLLLTFCSDAHEPEAILAALTPLAAGATIAGCSTAGEISSGGAGDGGVVVVALGGDGIAIEAAVGTDASQGLRAAGATAARCMDQLPQAENRLLMLLTDGRAGDQAEVIRGVHEIVGSGVPLIGGCAGDGVRMQGTFQLLGERALTDAVVGIGIASSGPLGLGWSHGWMPTGDPILITESGGNRVETIDDLPALDRYLEHFHAPEDVRTDPAAFTRWARVHPLGLGRRRKGQQPVRCVQEADFERRAIICTAEVPRGGLAWFMRGDAQSVLSSTRDACAAAIAGLEGHEPLGLIAFNCIGRRGILGDEGIAEEVELIEKTVGVPLAGFYTHGEIARTRGVNAVHSQTLAVLALG